MDTSFAILLRLGINVGGTGAAGVTARTGGLVVRRLTANIGVELRGVDLRAGIDDVHRGRAAHRHR